MLPLANPQYYLYLIFFLLVLNSVCHQHACYPHDIYLYDFMTMPGLPPSLSPSQFYATSSSHLQSRRWGCYHTYFSTFYFPSILTFFYLPKTIFSHSLLRFNKDTTFMIDTNMYVPQVDYRLQLYTKPPLAGGPLIRFHHQEGIFPRLRRGLGSFSSPVQTSAPPPNQGGIGITTRFPRDMPCTTH